MPDADFTSAHFLGLAPTGVPAALTTGRPAVVEHPEPGRLGARRFAAGQGAEDGLVARTSLHGLIDVLATRPPGAVVLLDEAIYAVGLWAARAVGAEVVAFRHRDARDAARQAPRRRRVVVLTDGLCGSCLSPAPLAELAAVAAGHDGELVVDDTLACGVLGQRDVGAPVLGRGGGGTAAWVGASPGPATVTVSSLSKGLAAPLTVVTGSRGRVDRMRRDGPSRVHASGPTAADLAALSYAVQLPESQLHRRRTRLARNVCTVRTLLHDLELRPVGIPFPVVLTEGGRDDPLVLHRALAAAGVRTLATTGRCTGRPTLTLCLRADHDDAAVGRLARALSAVVTGRAA